MHVLCWKAPDLRTSDYHLLPGYPIGSNCATDYRFGLLKSEIVEYKQLADLQHCVRLLKRVFMRSRNSFWQYM